PFLWCHYVLFFVVLFFLNKSLKGIVLEIGSSDFVPASRQIGSLAVNVLFSLWVGRGICAVWRSDVLRHATKGRGTRSYEEAGRAQGRGTILSRLLSAQ